MSRERHELLVSRKLLCRQLVQGLDDLLKTLLVAPPASPALLFSHQCVHWLAQCRPQYGNPRAPPDCARIGIHAVDSLLVALPEQYYAKALHAVTCPLPPALAGCPGREKICLTSRRHP